MKQPNEPIEALAFIFIHMAFTDGQATKTEIEAISEVLYDLMESDKQTQILSKRPSTDSVLILNHCLEQYINADSGNFLGNSIQFANEYLSQEEKKMLMNMLALVAKSDGEISEEEKNYYNHLVVEFGFNISNKKTETNKNIQKRKYTGDMYIDLFQMAGIWPSDLDLDNTDPDTLKREYSHLIDSSLRFIKNLEEDSAWYELIPTTSDDTYDQFRIIEDGGTHIGISEIRDRFDDDEMENYPWHKRGPLWYSSNIIINQRFKGPVIFMRDGFISINPKDEDTYVFISWENYSNFQRPDDHRLFLGNENVQLVIQAVNPNSTTQFSFSFASVVLEKLIVANQKSIGKLGLEHPPILPWDKRGVLELIK